jgi:hypothetical protein
MRIGYIQAARKTYPRSTTDEWVRGIREESRARIQNLVIVSKSQEKRFDQLTERFCSDADACIMGCESGNEGDGLMVAKDMY